MLGGAARAAEGEWLPGDTHAHVRPADDDGHVQATIDGTVAQARRDGVRWIILTPHFWRGRGEERARVEALAAFQRDARERNRRAAEAGDARAPLLIPGTEETRSDPGHLGLAFYEIDRAYAEREKHLGSLALAAEAQGGFVVLNHPFGKFGFDMTWKPWTSGRGPRDAEAREISERAHAIEAYNRMMAMGETILARPRERRQVEVAFDWIERAALRDGRRIVAVGGSDNHNLFFRATTWALVRGPLTEASLQEALRAGRVVIGENADASSFEARSDVASEWVPPGAVLRAGREVRLRWKGKAELFRDGERVGERELDGEEGFVDPIEPGSRHVYRIVVRRKSFANPVFVNLPEEVEAKADVVPAAPASPTGTRRVF